MYIIIQRKKFCNSWYYFKANRDFEHIRARFTNPQFVPLSRRDSRIISRNASHRHGEVEPVRLETEFAVNSRRFIGRSIKGPVLLLPSVSLRHRPANLGLLLATRRSLPIRHSDCVRSLTRKQTQSAYPAWARSVNIIAKVQTHAQRRCGLRRNSAATE